MTVTSAEPLPRTPAGPTLSLRQRIIAAAVETTTRSGWSSVTMARLAGVVGVSRQTVYNEIGSKPALAEAVVLDELARFLGVVESAFDVHTGDLTGSVRAAVRGVLGLAADSALLRTIVSGASGEDAGLLPPLTTRSLPLLDTAKSVLGQRLAPFATHLDERRLAATADVVVRVVLSHVMQPSAPAETTADEVAWLTQRLLSAESWAGDGEREQDQQERADPR